MPTRIAAKNIANSLIASFVMVGVCLMIRPAGFNANDGLSYFGGFLSTLFPYSVGLIIGAYYYWQASQCLPTKHPQLKVLYYSFQIIACLLIGLLVTPHNLVNPLHTAIGSTLFVYQLGLSIWLAWETWPNQLAAWFVVIEFISGLFAFYYLPRSFGFMLQSQIVFQLAFGLLIINVLKNYSQIKPHH